MSVLNPSERPYKAAPPKRRKRKSALERSVDRETARVRAGKSRVKADTGDVRPVGMRPSSPTRVAQSKADVDKALRGPRVKVDTGDMLTKSDKRRAGKPKPIQIRQSGIVPGDGALKGAGKGLLNLGKDIVFLPKTVVQGGYETAAAVAEAATGDTKRIKKLAKGLSEHDPFYLAGDAAIKTVQGKGAAAKRQLAKSVDELAAHPGLATIEAMGGTASVGKGVTRVQRKAGKNPTIRESARFPDSNLVQPRKYTDNAFQRGVDKVREKQRIQGATAKRSEASRLEKADPAGTVSQVEKLRRDANRQDPRVLNDRQARVRAARSAATGRVVTQRNQAATAKAVRVVLTPPKGSKLRPRRATEKPSAAHSLSTQGIADVHELAAYRAKIAARLKDPKVADYEKVSMRKTMADIDAAIKSAPDQVQVTAAAKGYKAIVEPLQKDLYDRKVLDPKRGEKAPMVPHSIEHMPGVVPGPKGPMRKATESDHAVTPVSVARAAQRAADKALEKAVAAHAKAVGRAQILTRNVSGVEKTRAGYTGGSRAVNEAKAALDTARANAIAARKTRVKAEQQWRSDAGRRKQASAGRKGYVRVTAAEIRAHMGDEKASRTAFVSQRPAGSAGGAKGGTLSPPTTGAAVRTGRSTELGSADFSPQGMVDTARNSQRLKDLADNYATTLSEAGSKQHSNLTRSAATKRAKDLAARHGVEYRVVPVNPFEGNTALARTLDDAEGPDSTTAGEAIREAVVDAYSGKAESANGKYTLVPKAYAQELIDQANDKRPTGAIGTTMRGQNSLFRRTVLATSPTWITGNAVEGALRAAIGGVRPGDKKVFNRIVAELDKTDPRLAQELRARVAGGGHYQSVDMAGRGSVLDGYHGTSLERPARALQSFWDKPTAKGAADLWGHYTHFVFNQLSGRMESSIQTSMAGAAIRRGHLMPNDEMLRAIHVSDKAVQQAARGLTNTSEQAALGEVVARMYGRYDGFTADARFYIANFTPFAAWALNAANFVLRVLPQDHPTFVALAAAQEKATRDIRKDAKLDELPDWMAGSIPISGGRYVRAIRYTPFGFFTEAGANASNLVLPQFTGVRNALSYGTDWKGQKVYKNGKVIEGEDRALLALQSFSEATIPLMGKIKQVMAKGPASLNPFNPVGTPKKKSKAYTAPSGGGDAGNSSGIDFSTFSGGGASGIDFEGFSSP